MRTSKRALVQAAEHLKGYSVQTLEQFKEGIIPSVAEAAAKLAAETHATLQDLHADAFADLLLLRVTLQVPSALEQTTAAIQANGGQVQSLRYLGPREEGGVGVLYVACLVRAPSAVYRILNAIESDVRDWSYGCVRRGAA
jgi:hypothetical protein